MPKSKHRKNHKNKVKSRNLRISEEKRRIEKAKNEFINKLIEQEKEKGLFDNLSKLNSELENTQIEGPII
jgi:hypothetical protein